LDINKSVKKDNHGTQSKLTPVPSFPKEMQQNGFIEPNKPKLDSFQHTYANYVNEGNRLNMHAEKLNKKNQ